MSVHCPSNGRQAYAGLTNILLPCHKCWRLFPLLYCNCYVFLSGNSTESSTGLLLIAKAIQACRLMWHGVFGRPNQPLNNLGSPRSLDYCHNLAKNHGLWFISHAFFVQTLGQMHVEPKPWLKLLLKFGRASLGTSQTSLVNQCNLQKNQCGSEKWNKKDYQLTNSVPSRECIEGVTSNTLKYGASTRCICWQYNADLMSYRWWLRK